MAVARDALSVTNGEAQKAGVKTGLEDLAHGELGEVYSGLVGDP